MFHAPFNVGLYKSLINGAVIFSVIPFCANYKASSSNQTVVIFDVNLQTFVGELVFLSA